MRPAYYCYGWRYLSFLKTVKIIIRRWCGLTYVVPDLSITHFPGVTKRFQQRASHESASDPKHKIESQIVHLSLICEGQVN